MAVEGYQNFCLGNTGSPVVNGLSKRRGFHMFWNSVVIGRNPTLTFLFVTAIFSMAMFEIPCEMQMLILFSGQRMDSVVLSGPKF